MLATVVRNVGKSIHSEDMGRAKQKDIEDNENGYISGRELNVCERHFEDEDILKFIRKKGDPNLVCLFCDDLELDDEDPIVTKKVSWDSLMERIVPCIRNSYDDPGNGLSYESAEGGYLGNIYDTRELLTEEIGLNADESVIEEIVNTIYQDTWTEAEFYSETYSDHLSYSWDAFSNLVKYKVRYLFNDILVDPDEYSISHKPFEILKHIGEFIKELDLILTIPDNSELFSRHTTIFRARQHKASVDVSKCKDIGTPPNELATANRFSAEGIAIFYGSSEAETAINEVIDKKDKEDFISIGEFQVQKKLTLVDLRNIRIVGFFDTENIRLREPSLFLRNFVSIISKKLNRKSNRRIEYIPSQIVTEYFRHILPSTLHKKIDGIIYRSSLDSDKDCYAIFADQTECSDEGEENERTILTLKKGKIRRKVVSNIS
jgi:hypothetical protein